MKTFLLVVSIVLTAAAYVGIKADEAIVYDSALIALLPAAIVLALKTLNE